MGRDTNKAQAPDGHRARAKRATSGRTAIEKADAQAAAALAPAADMPAVRAVSAATDVADQPPLVALSAAVALTGLATRNARLARAGARMLAAHALATWAKGVLKDHIDRSRPRVLIHRGHYAMRAGDSDDSDLRSFPSGHTAGGVAVVRALAREYPAAGVPAGTAMSAIASGLISKQAHYPTDVAAGAAIGWLAEAVVDFAWTRLRRLPNRVVTR
ncbi:MAG TPA: phosphatase PAP2 family protein [Sphingomonas sp.]|jgi:membrane-associated phospholipid phosphatase|uniref:phosphatase PAP2 family protein n=1 Tax=Sphingomonas sp. TaxID=28214 RepID=UPI002ED805DE